MTGWLAWPGWLAGRCQFPGNILMILKHFCLTEYISNVHIAFVLFDGQVLSRETPLVLPACEAASWAGQASHVRWARWASAREGCCHVAARFQSFPLQLSGVGGSNSQPPQRSFCFSLSARGRARQSEQPMASERYQDTFRVRMAVGLPHRGELLRLSRCCVLSVGGVAR